MPSIWRDRPNRQFKPIKSLTSLGHWAAKWDVMIIDQQDDPVRNFIDFKYGSKPNNAVNTILKSYCNDLGFPRPRSFSVHPWTTRRIFVTKIEGIRTYQRIRALSLLHERKVFHLWGREARQLKPAIEPDRGHLIVECDYPFTDPRTLRSFLDAKPFSTTCDFLQCSKELWRL